jgi:hypothetical protein
LFVLVVNKNQPHGRVFGTTTCFLTGSKKPGGDNITRTRASLESYRD